MKYWWLKKYKGLKIKLIPDLTNDVNMYFIMPKNYKDRYLAIKDSDISLLSEEDLRIMLYAILNHEKIKNNRIILIIDHLLEFPDNALPATNYTLDEMLEEITNLKENKPTEEKLEANNVAACYHCCQVFFVDKIKYVNKKGHCLCPYCKSPTLYFDNDFIPMDENFLRLAKLVYDSTPLGCSFKNLQKIIKKGIQMEEQIPLVNTAISTAIITKAQNKDIVLEKDHIRFDIKEITFKQEITSKEEQHLHYTFYECFQIIEKNIISRVVIDLSIIPNEYSSLLTLLIFLLEMFGRNPYLKEIVLVSSNKEIRKNCKSLINSLERYQKKKIIMNIF